METIEKIIKGDPEFGFENNTDNCSWKNIFDWIYKDEHGDVFKKRFLEQFYKV